MKRFKKNSKLRTIHWEATIDDALAFYQYYVETDAEVRHRIRIRQFLVPVLVWVVLMLMTRNWNLGIGFAVLSVVWIVITPAWIRREMVDNAHSSYQLPENFNKFGTREMTFGNEGFLLKTEMCETLYKWKVVAGVNRIPGYCFIDIAAQEMLIIPEGRLTLEEIATLKNALEKYVIHPVNRQRRQLTIFC